MVTPGAFEAETAVFPMEGECGAAGPRPATPGLLDGLRILDLGIWRPVPYATQLLAEMGADVLKIEPPGGDPLRAFPELFAVVNAGKRSMLLDLKSPGDRELLRSLAAGADAVLEGFRPGVVRRLAADYESLCEVNPRLVYCSVSGYGGSGPLAHLPGHDLDYQAYAGALAPDGGAPVVSSLPIGDLAAGMAAALATVAACLHARSSGEGERIDIGIADVLATWTGAVGSLTHADSAQPADGFPGYGVYPTSDGRYVSIGVVTEDHLWDRLCDALDLEELRRSDVATRLRKKNEFDDAIRTEVARRPLAEVRQLLEEHGVPAAPVLDRAEMLALPQLRSRGTVMAAGTGGAATAGDVPAGDAVMGHFARLTYHPARAGLRAPVLDEHRGETWL